MSKISVCILARNEEEFIASAIESVRTVADEVVVLDTGSNDDTVGVARRMGAEVHTREWGEDFAEARNTLLELAKHPVVLMLDADEVLAPQSIEEVRRFARSTAVAGNCTVNNILPSPYGVAMISVQSVRLFRKANMQYRGRVHEDLSKSMRQHTVSPQAVDITINHMGYVDSDPLRRLRNRRVFESALQADPTDAWVRLHLALGYYRDGEIVKADDYFQYLLRTQSPEVKIEARSMVIALVGEIALRNGQKVQARSWAVKAREIGGNLFAEALLATIDMEEQKYDAAVQRLLGLDSKSLGQSAFVVDKSKLYAELVKCYFKLSQLDKALQYADLCRTETPMYEPMVIGGYIAESRGDFRRALRFYEEAMRLSPGNEAITRKIQHCRKLVG